MKYEFRVYGNSNTNGWELIKLKQEEQQIYGYKKLEKKVK